MSDPIRYEVRIHEPEDDCYVTEEFEDVLKAETFYDELIDTGTDCKVELLLIETLDEWMPGDDLERGN